MNPFELVFTMAVTKVAKKVGFQAIVITVNTEAKLSKQEKKEFNKIIAHKFRRRFSL
jgi:imidazole glycerol phosphate synthase subunit HisF